MVNSTRNILSYLPLILLFGIIAFLLHAGLLLSDNVLVDHDLVTYFYPLWELRSEALKSLSLPIWNPYVFGGVPFLANIQTAVFYPLNWPLSFLEAPKVVALSYVLHLWMAGAFMFLFARASLGLVQSASFLAGLVFMLSGFFAAQVGHINQVNAAAWLPLIFLFTDTSIRRRRPLYIALGGLTLALQLLAGHPQESYMSLVMLAAYALFLAARQTWEYVDASRSSRMLDLSPDLIGVSALNSDNKVIEDARSIGTAHSLAQRSRIVASKYLRNLMIAFLCLSGIVLLGIAIASVQLLPTLELTRYSIRAGGFSLPEATSFSLPPWEIGRSILPAFKDYPFSEYVAYVGFVPLALVFAAVLARRTSGYLWFFVIILLLSLLMALGRSTPVFEWMYVHLPGVSLFRVPARWLFMYTFAAAALAGLGFNILSAMPSAKGLLLRRRLVAVVCTVAIIMALWVVFYRLVGGVLTAPSSYGLLLWPLVAGTATLIVALWWSFPQYKVFPALALLLTLGELTLARLDLPAYNLAPGQAYSSLRPGMLGLMAQDGLFRYLSLADTAYVPGDYYEVLPVLERYLDKDGVYNYFTMLKQRDAMIPNTGIASKLSSIDGYDGGLLPLKSYFAVKQLLMGGNDESVLDDTPLVYSLKSAPDAGALGLLNVKYLMDDRLKDLWKDGIYYDLTFERQVSASSPLRLTALSDFETTSVGVVARLVDGPSLPQGEAVARVIVEDGYGQRINHSIRAGQELADSAASPDAPNSAALHGTPTSSSIYNTELGSYSYAATIDLGAPMYPRRISIEPVVDNGVLIVNAVSLLDGRTGANISVPIHSDWKPIYVGDLKIYENMRWLPRAYLATDYLTPESNEDAIRLMADGIEGKVVLDRPPSGWEKKESGAEVDRKSGYIVDAKSVDIVENMPGKVSVKVSTNEDALLVLSESYYPGWVATIDGQDTEVLLANQMFQAVHVPKGEHTVNFEYQARFLGLGFLATLGGLVVAFSMIIAWPLLLFLVFVMTVLPARRRRRVKASRGD